jgi:hypothetical protein
MERTHAPSHAAIKYTERAHGGRIFLCEQLQPDQFRVQYLILSSVLIASVTTLLIMLPCALSVWYEWAITNTGAFDSTRFSRAFEIALRCFAVGSSAIFVLVALSYAMANGVAFGLAVAVAFGFGRAIVLSYGMHNTLYGEPYPPSEAFKKGAFLVIPYALTLGGALWLRARGGTGHERDQVVPLERANWRWSEFFKGSVIGLPFAPLFYYGLGQANGTWLGCLGVLFAGIFAGLRGATAHFKIMPNQGIHQSFWTAVRVGLTFTLCFMLVVGWAYHKEFVGGSNPRHAVTNGLLAGAAMASSMFFGLVPVLQHCAVRLLLWHREKVPLALPSFLSDAATKPFLRRVGAGYLFRHEGLRQYFLRRRSTGKGDVLGDSLVMAPKATVNKDAGGRADPTE